MGMRHMNHARNEASGKPRSYKWYALAIGITWRPQSSHEYHMTVMCLPVTFQDIVREYGADTVRLFMLFRVSGTPHECNEDCLLNSLYLLRHLQRWLSSGTLRVQVSLNFHGLFFCLLPQPISHRCSYSGSPQVAEQALEIMPAAHSGMQTTPT